MNTSEGLSRKTADQAHLFCQCRVLLQELYDTVGQLRMVHTQTLDFMQRNQDSCEEQLMFFLERQRETIDDRSQDLKKLCDAIESLCFIDELEEHVVDGPSNV